MNLSPVLFGSRTPSPHPSRSDSEYATSREGSPTHQDVDIIDDYASMPLHVRRPVPLPPIPLEDSYTPANNAESSHPLLPSLPSSRSLNGSHSDRRYSLPTLPSQQSLASVIGIAPDSLMRPPVASNSPERRHAMYIERPNDDQPRHPVNPTRAGVTGGISRFLERVGQGLGLRRPSIPAARMESEIPSLMPTSASTSTIGTFDWEGAEETTPPSPEALRNEAQRIVRNFSLETGLNLPSHEELPTRQVSNQRRRVVPPPVERYVPYNEGASSGPPRRGGQPSQAPASRVRRTRVESLLPRNISPGTENLDHRALQNRVAAFATSSGSGNTTSHVPLVRLEQGIDASAFRPPARQETRSPEDQRRLDDFALYFINQFSNRLASYREYAARQQAPLIRDLSPEGFRNIFTWVNEQADHNLRMNLFENLPGLFIHPAFVMLQLSAFLDPARTAPRPDRASVARYSDMVANDMRVIIPRLTRAQRTDLSNTLGAVLRGESLNQLQQVINGLTQNFGSDFLLTRVANSAFAHNLITQQDPERLALHNSLSVQSVRWDLIPDLLPAERSAVRNWIRSQPDENLRRRLIQNLYPLWDNVMQIRGGLSQLLTAPPSQHDELLTNIRQVEEILNQEEQLAFQGYLRDLSPNDRQRLTELFNNEESGVGQRLGLTQPLPRYQEDELPRSSTQSSLAPTYRSRIRASSTPPRGRESLDSNMPNPYLPLGPRRHRSSPSEYSHSLLILEDEIPVVEEATGSLLQRSVSNPELTMPREDQALRQAFQNVNDVLWERVMPHQPGMRLNEDLRSYFARLDPFQRFNSFYQQLYRLPSQAQDDLRDQIGDDARHALNTALSAINPSDLDEGQRICIGRISRILGLSEPTADTSEPA